MNLALAESIAQAQVNGWETYSPAQYAWVSEQVAQRFRGLEIECLRPFRPDSILALRWYTSEMIAHGLVTEAQVAVPPKRVCWWEGPGQCHCETRRIGGGRLEWSGHISDAISPSHPLALFSRATIVAAACGTTERPVRRYLHLVVDNTR